MTAEAEKDWVDEIGKPAAASIVEMVACLQCDRERLEELRDERDGFEIDPDANSAPDGPGYANDREAWAGENPDDAKELAELEAAVQLDGDEQDEDQARERIQEDALSVRIFGERVDGTWEADKFEILLSTGGPAVRIMGELDEHNEPSRAWLEVQDWFKPWTQYFDIEQETLLAYCRCFYFGE